MKWARMPETWGWYFFTPRVEEWDLTNPVSVERVEYGDGRVEFRTARGDRKAVTPDMGWWYGPVRVPRPDEELRDV